MPQAFKNKRFIVLFSIVIFLFIGVFCFKDSIFKEDVNAAGCSATGGTVTQVNGYCIHTFTSNGTFTPSDNMTADVLVVAGGGGGGGDGYGGHGAGEGGGGAGGLIYNAAYTITSGAPITVTVGNGGTGGANTGGYNVGSNGGNSSFGASLIAIGGGAGGAGTTSGLAGGSGGGAGYSGSGGAATSGQGYAGASGSTGSPYAGHGGGGAGGAGSAASSNSVGGIGGIGRIYFGTTYAAGGAGANSWTAGNGVNGTANTGNGGSGAGGGVGGTGGSGVVIVRYPLAPCPATGGTVTQVGGYCIHTFTSNGTFTPSGNMNVEYLVVGGGGAGGSSYSGGGGAGGYRTNMGGQNLSVSGVQTVTVGAGGITSDPGGNGGSSSFGVNGGTEGVNLFTSTGGGGGGKYGSGNIGGNGGSGGGGSGTGTTSGTTIGGSGNTPSTTPSQGNNGGNGGSTNSAYQYGGGGGGSAAIGGNGGGTSSSAIGGNGGAGTLNNITGTSLVYAAGGGGAVEQGTPGTGGSGVGGNGGAYKPGMPTSSPTPGAVNTGSGGGGGIGGRNGGSGIVVVRYPLPVILSYRRPITINNTSNANVLTNYQVSMTVDTASLISLGKMNSDCSDIRFTDNSVSYNTADWTNNYPYWIESGCNTSTTKIWVKVDTIAASSNKTIYMYYGNSSATAFSSGDSTFVFFDDFTGTAINTSKWVKTDAAGYITQNNALTISNGTAGWGATEMHTNANFNRADGLAIQGKYKSTMVTGATYKDTTMLWVKDSGTGTNYTDYINALYLYSTGAPALSMYEDGTNRTSVLGGFVTNTQYIIRQIVKTGGGALTQMSSDGGETWTDNYNSVYSTETPFKVGFTHYQGGDVIIDDVIVRKYSSPEPFVPVTHENCPATGGTITEAGGYCIHKFTSSGTFTTPSNLSVDYLVVAGGGGGGAYVAAGGGGGGFRTGSAYAVTAGSMPITVGAGGAASTNGGDSIFGTITSTGGGRGGSYQSGPGA
jgi:hypothetical protein